ncbi:MAG: hypothetical protein ACUZ8I_06155 [Candidatus Scalindua sp.]
MPEIWVWGLLASVIAIALIASLKAAEFRFELKMSEQVITGLWKKIDTLNEKNDQSVPNKPNLNAREPEKPSNTSHSQDPLHEILKSIAKYHSQEIPATPERIATDINLDSEITLAYMWKYHNEQFITFRTGGKKPGIETPFFLSPKALEKVDIVKKQT